MPSHELLLERLSESLTGTVPPLPNDYYLMLDRDYEGIGKTHGSITANYQAMAWAVEYARVRRGGAVPEWSRYSPLPQRIYTAFWREKILDYFRSEREIGLFRNEQLAADPHHDYHLASVLLIRIAALETRDTEVEAESQNWIENLMAIYSAVASPNGRIFMPCARCRGLPQMETASRIYQDAIGLKPIGRSRKDITARKAYRILIEHHRDTIFAACAKSPLDWRTVKLKYPMAIHRDRNSISMSIITQPPHFYAKADFCNKVEVEFLPKWKSGSKMLVDGELYFQKGWVKEYGKKP